MAAATQSQSESEAASTSAATPCSSDSCHSGRSGKRGVANKKCENKSCKACCVTTGGCKAAGHGRGGGGGGGGRTVETAQPTDILIATIEAQLSSQPTAVGRIPTASFLERRKEEEERVRTQSQALSERRANEASLKDQVNLVMFRKVRLVSLLLIFQISYLNLTGCRVPFTHARSQAVAFSSKSTQLAD